MGKGTRSGFDDETPNDTQLKNFSIQNDIDNFMIGGLKQGLASG
jgi:hypothetical protein